MLFRDVRHQERALALIRRALASGRMPHAYLFEGPEGVGKELAARALAGRLLCRGERLPADGEACGTCVSCRLFPTSNHPDFHLIHRGLHRLHPDRTIRAGKGLFLVVDLIRHFLIGPAALKPSQGRRRVFLVRDAERMNEEAQNALLKTLEEPPGTACLILVTASASRLLPTIRSRCQSVPFGPLPTDFVAAELRSRLKLAADQAQTLAALAEGRLGVAIRWQQVGLLDALPQVAEAVEGLEAADPEAFSRTLVEVATSLAARGLRAAEGETGPAEDQENAGSAVKSVATDELRDALKLVLMLLAALYRDALLIAAGATRRCALARQRRQVERLTALGFDRLEGGLQAIREAERMLDRNVAAQLAGERLAVALRGEIPVV